MHPNPTFRKSTDTENLKFAVNRSFGTLAINGKAGPIFAHIPFQLSKDAKYLEAHLVRSNPIIRALDTPLPAVIVINSSDAYISPDWYDVDDQVPTWNYVAVHLRGTLQRLPDKDLRGILERLSESMEQRLLPKPIWHLDKLSNDAWEKMRRQILPIKMDIETIDGTWKLGQNKPADARLSAAKALENDGFGLNYAEIATLMKNPPN